MERADQPEGEGEEGEGKTGDPKEQGGNLEQEVHQVGGGWVLRWEKKASWLF